MLKRLVAISRPATSLLILTAVHVGGAHAQSAVDLNPGWIGGTCEGSFDCLEPGFTAKPACETVGFPGGMCTQRCERSAASNRYVCPDANTARGTLNTGTFCIAAPGHRPACVSRCNFNKSPTGCRSGYSCVEQPRFGDVLRSAEVCLPTEAGGWPRQAALRPYTPALNLHQVDAELPGPEVFALTQDAEGFLWIATPAGLAKYDGRHVRRSPKLSDNTIRALLADEDGALWVGTGEGGLNRIDHDVVKVYDEASGLSGNTVTAIVAGPPGQLFVGTTQGLSKLDVKSSEFEVIEFFDPDDSKSLSHNVVRALFLDGDGLWIGTAAGLDRLSVKTGEIAHYRQNMIAGGAVTAIAKDTEGTMWYGSDRGLYSMVGDELSFYPHDSTDPGSLSASGVTSLLVDTKGELWVGTSGDDGGLNKLDRAGNRFIRYMPKRYVTSLFQDREGVVWIGVKYTDKGLWKVPPANFATYRSDPDEPNALHSIANWGVYPEPGGPLWVGAMLDGAGLYRFNRRSGQVDRFVHDPANPLSITDSNVTSIAPDAEGGLWVGTLHGGLNYFDSTTGEAERYPPDPSGFPATTVWALATDKSGRLWIGTQNHGLLHYDADNDRFVGHDDENTSPGERTVLGIFPDQVESSILWLTTSAGLIMFDAESGAHKSYAGEPESPERIGDVVHVHQDAEGRMWLATVDSGLVMLDPETDEIQRFGVADGLPTDAVACVLGGDNDEIWLATYKGITRFDPKSRTAVSFDESDGVQIGEPIDGRCYRDPESNEIFVSGLGGIVVFNPSAVVLDSRPPELDITQVERFGSDLPLSVDDAGNRVASFGYRDVLSVSFAVLSYAGKTSAAYRLKGLDDDWLTANADHVVTYSYLPPGRYTFQVKGANRHGVWNEASASLEFDVAPPWWRTWWAYAGYAVMVLALIAAYWWYQQRKILRIREQGRLSELESDMALAGAAQSWFLPKEANVIEGRLAISGSYIPATKCGGDWWWYEKPNDNTRWLLVADVTGHGAGSAILTSSAATAFRSVASDVNGADILWRFGRLHDEIWAACQGRSQMTLTAVVLDETTGVGRMYNAGGWPVLCQDITGKIRAVSATGTPLGGSAEKPQFGQVDLRVGVGERLFIYTDGLPETTMQSGKMVGLRRFRKMIVATREINIHAAVARIVDETTQLRGPPDAEDDVTLIGAEWRGA